MKTLGTHESWVEARIDSALLQAFAARMASQATALRRAQEVSGQPEGQVLQGYRRLVEAGHLVPPRAGGGVVSDAGRRRLRELDSFLARTPACPCGDCRRSP